MVSSLVVPKPPGLPSMTQFLAPFKSMIVVVFDEEIERPVTPVPGLIVIELLVLKQTFEESVIGKVSEEETYEEFSSRIIFPAIPRLLRALTA
jgi:hypothetical protein